MVIPTSIPVPHVAPLCARKSLREDWPDPRAVRDQQVFPRHVRATDAHQQTYRTAAIKNHTRGMTERPDMQTTHQHDFGVEVSSKPRSSSLTVPSSSNAMQRLPP